MPHRKLSANPVGVSNHSRGSRADYPYVPSSSYANIHHTQNNNVYHDYDQQHSRTYQQQHYSSQQLPHGTSSSSSTNKKFTIRLSRICFGLGLILFGYLFLFRYVLVENSVSNFFAGMTNHDVSPFPRIVVYDRAPTGVMRGSINSVLRHVISEEKYLPKWMKEELVSRSWTEFAQVQVVWVKEMVQAVPPLVSKGVAMVDSLIHPNAVKESQPEETKAVAVVKEVEAFKQQGNFKTGIDLWQYLPAHSFASRNLVLGMATNVEVRKFAVFCGSLFDNLPEVTTNTLPVVVKTTEGQEKAIAEKAEIAKAPRDAVVILFATGYLTKRHHQIAKEYNIVLIPYDVNAFQTTSSTGSAMKWNDVLPSNLRWILFDWLLQQSVPSSSRMTMLSSFDKIMIADVDKVAFMSPMFSLIDTTKPDVHVMAGGERAAVGTTTTISKSIQTCFGERIWNLIRDQPLVLADVILGRRQEMSVLITKMQQLITGEYPCFRTSYPTCQSVDSSDVNLNVLLHMGHLDTAVVQSPLTFPMLNLETYAELVSHVPVSAPVYTISVGDNKGNSLRGAEQSITTMAIPAKTKTVLAGGSTYAILSNYDFDENLLQSYTMQYASFVLEGGSNVHPITDFVQTSACYNYGMIMGLDILRGKCDWQAKHGTTAASCCALCSNSAGICHGFTFSEGVCYLKSCSQDEFNVMVNYVHSSDFNDGNLLVSNAISGYQRVVAAV